jgi:hypothetical protein
MSTDGHHEDDLVMRRGWADMESNKTLNAVNVVRDATGLVLLAATLPKPGSSPARFLSPMLSVRLLGWRTTWRRWLTTTDSMSKGCPSRSKQS